MRHKSPQEVVSQTPPEKKTKKSEIVPRMSTLKVPLPQGVALKKQNSLNLCTAGKFLTLKFSPTACLLGQRRGALAKLCAGVLLNINFQCIAYSKKAALKCLSKVFCRHLQKLLLAIPVEVAACKTGDGKQAHSGYKKGVEAPRGEKK